MIRLERNAEPQGVCRARREVDAGEAGLRGRLSVELARAQGEDVGHRGIDAQRFERRALELYGTEVVRQREVAQAQVVAGHDAEVGQVVHVPYVRGKALHLVELGREAARPVLDVLGVERVVRAEEHGDVGIGFVARVTPAIYKLVAHVLVAPGGNVRVVAPEPAISDVKLILSSGAAEMLKLETYPVPSKYVVSLR